MNQIELTTEPDRYSNFKPKLYRDAWRDHCTDLESEGFCLYHLTVTYLKTSGTTYRVSDYERLFVKLYVHGLLPKLFTNNFHRLSKKKLQPLVLAFLEEHHPIIKWNGSTSAGVPIYTSSTKLHHHCIVASRPGTKAFFDSMIGLDTFKKYSSSIMSTDFKKCDPGRVTYAAYELNKYPDPLAFGFRD